MECWSTPLQWLCEVCWILAGTGTRCHIHQSRAFLTCSMGDMSSEYAGHARTGMFSASRNCVQILTTWGRALSCCNMRWWSWMNGTAMGLRILSRSRCAFKVQGSRFFIIRHIHNHTSIISSEMQVELKKNTAFTWGKWGEKNNPQTMLLGEYSVKTGKTP